MFKLTKAELEARADLVGKLNDSATALMKTIDEYNDELERLRGPIEDALSAYNELVAEARDFASDVASQADSDIADKSEKWQDSERGQAAIAFKDEWEGLVLEDVEIDFPEELSVDEPDHAGILESATDEMAS